MTSHFVVENIRNRFVLIRLAVHIHFVCVLWRGAGYISVCSRSYFHYAIFYFYIKCGFVAEESNAEYFLAKLGSLIIWKYSVLLRYINKIWTVVWLCGLFPQNWMQILFQWILQDSLSIYTYICSSPYIIHFILNNDAEAAAAAAATTATAQIEEQNKRKKPTSK